MASVMNSLLFVVTTLLLPSAINSYYIPESTNDVVKRALDLVRDKRYTDTQERASSFCTGLCMYEERRAYSDCFDLCNWNGRSPSPWVQLDKARNQKESENSVENYGSMIRMGGNAKGKASTEKAKNKGRSGGMKKEHNSWGNNNY